VKRGGYLVNIKIIQEERIVHKFARGMHIQPFHQRSRSCKRVTASHPTNSVQIDGFSKRRWPAAALYWLSILHCICKISIFSAIFSLPLHLANA